MRILPGMRLVAVVLATGVLAGIGGTLLALLLHAVQHLAYGYGFDGAPTHASFLSGVEHASAPRRVLVMLACGVVAGAGWWAVARYGARRVSVEQAVSDAGATMPPATTLAHVLLQIVTVGLGSPLGREVAPRELGALLGSALARRCRLAPEQATLVVACGAGAGLAAVYNVPMAGAVFVLEVLLAAFSWQAAVLAMASSALGASIAWIGLGHQVQYQLPPMDFSPALLVWSLLAGPAIGVAAWAMRRWTDVASRAAADEGPRPLLAVLNFGLIGVAAIAFPQLLGNGRGPAQLGFAGELGVQLALCLLALKVLATAGSLRVGAHGGLLTPSLAIGALLAVPMGLAWSLLWPGVPQGAFALVGGAAFLGAFMRMPLTAVMLMVEFTRFDHDLAVPVLLAVAGASLVFRRLGTVRGGAGG